MDGALMEIGPYRVRENGVLEYNEGSWDEFANLLFVDNPVGTGFSYVNTDSFIHELQEMADQFITFLDKWFALFPEYEHDDIYIAGESYAGQHIPYIAKTILDRNKNRADNEHHWNLSGLLIGNGWISPLEHYQSYKKFALEENLIQSSSPGFQRIEQQENTCFAAIGKPEGKDHVDDPACESILSTILDVTKETNQCLNMYDVRLKDSFPSCGMNWPPDLTTVTPYLRRDDVTAALHINKDKRTGWTECSGAVSANFRASRSKPSIQFLPSILESSVPILLFSGAKDLICNHLGTESLINTLSWSNGTGFELSPGVWAPKRSWTFASEPAGLYQSARNLTYVLFYNSSHMVPFDYPRRTRDMLDRFMGVDIASIGGTPADSRIDGEPAGNQTSVGGHTNSTAAELDQKEKLREAELAAYYRSGEAVLVVVVLAAAAFGWWVWRGRRRERLLGYASVSTNGHVNGGSGFRSKFGRDADGGDGSGDVEAQDFDASEMEEFRDRDTRHEGGVAGNGRGGGDDDVTYSLGSDSEDEDDGVEPGTGSVRRHRA